MITTPPWDEIDRLVGAGFALTTNKNVPYINYIALNFKNPLFRTFACGRRSTWRLIARASQRRSSTAHHAPNAVCSRRARTRTAQISRATAKLYGDAHYQVHILVITECVSAIVCAHRSCDASRNGRQRVGHRRRANGFRDGDLGQPAGTPLVRRKRRHPALSRSLGEASRGVQMKIEKDSVIDSEHIVVAPSVTIGRNVKLGMVWADQFPDDGVSLIPLEPFSADAPSGCWSAR
jgi:hypothetical protein